ncbi:putative oxidoreductase [Aspergillus lucknowensis]|uniref:Oxidoreductase n=1 Tax=Aspergillus lucknowensis TaxID=176173 RepID=A0ABR4L9Q5_9EURO
MPIPLITKGITEGLSSIPHIYTVLKFAPWLLLIVALKYYFGGARNGSERLMHSKVVMVTGGTSGIGASVVYELASRGAQVILLTQQSQSDIFLIDYIEDLRKSTGNQLIYAEQVDLSSLHSIRTFATKWIDNVPPRRLDMLVFCATTASPNSSKRKVTVDGIDEEWQVNYLANFHLLSILSPALRVQPPHRDVRIIMTTCSSYIAAPKLDFSQLDSHTIPPNKPTANSRTTTKQSRKPASTPRPKPKPNRTRNPQTPKSLFALSKLSLMIFANSFQKHLNAFKRPDGQPPSTRVILVDPGYSRTPGTRRWLTCGSLWGLLLYLLTWPLWWLVLKSPPQGAQSILYAAMEARFGRGEGGWMIKECREVDFARTEITDDGVGKQLWELSERQIEAMEKEGAVKRALAKKEKEEEEQMGRSSKAASGSKSASSGGVKEQTAGSRRSRRGNGNKS